MFPGITLSLVLLIGTIAALLLDSNRPALPSAVYASGAPGGITLPDAPTPVMALARWDMPTLTPKPPAATRAPAALSRANGPASLELWNGETVSVMAANGQWQSGVFQWDVPRDAAGWHTDTPDCGDGVTIIGGHIAYDGLPGVFAPLVSIGEGDTVTCLNGRGVERRFAPVDYILSSGQEPATWRPAWSPALLLYTCAPELTGQLVVIRFREEP